MSGICGIVHFDGTPFDRAPSGGAPDALRAMTEAAAHRGPDGLRSWTGAGAAVAHLALHVTPEAAREMQPLIEDHLTLVADARIDNRSALIRLLGVSQEATDAALILAAYRRWGAGCAEHLIGDFAFVVWDARRRRLFAARDPMALRPLYYRAAPDRLLFASEVKQLLAAPGVDARVSESAVAAHLAGRFGRLDRTFYEGISQLPPAHAMAADASGSRTWRYWDVDPEARITYGDEGEYAEHFLELFEEAVRCRLRSTHPVGLLLSGGMDSTCVAATAGRLMERRETACPAFRTYSWAFDELTQCDERAVSDPIVERYGLPATSIDAEAAAPLEHYPADAPDADEPFVGVYQTLLQRAHATAQADGVRLMLSGHRGDLVVGEWIFDYVGLLRSGRWLTLERELRAHTRQLGMPMKRTLARYLYRPIRKALWPKDRAEWLRGPLRRAYRTVRPAPPLDLYPNWVRPAFAERTGMGELSAPMRTPFGGLRSHARQRRYRAVLMPLHMRVAARAERNGARVGLQTADPWSDRRLIEFALAVPQRALSRAGQNKRLARAAMRGVMPEAARRNAGKTDPSPLYKRALRERARDTVHALTADSHAAARGWVDEEALQAYYERFLRGEDEDHRFWYTLALEMWLRRHTP